MFYEYHLVLSSRLNDYEFTHRSMHSKDGFKQLNLFIKADTSHESSRANPDYR